MSESSIENRPDISMESSIEIQLKDLPTYLPVVVIMQKQPSNVSLWSEYDWDAIGVMTHNVSAATIKTPQLVHEEGEIKHYLYDGFKVQLHVDECESYYYNLISPTPRCYVIASYNEDNVPVPFMVTMSFDDAHGYMETDEQVYAIDVPPELYRWTEDFVLMHYAPEQRKKRKRDDWKVQDKEGQSIK